MRLVERPVFKPMRCAAIPHMGQTKDTRWIDTGTEMPGFDNHVYLSEVAVHEAARLLGFPTPKEHAALGAELAATLEQLGEAYDTIAGLSKYAEAVEEIRSGVA